MQLDATLRSLELNQTDGETIETHVLYRASTPGYEGGYRILERQHPRVVLHSEADFKADLVDLLVGSTHVLFLVDDSIFVAEFSATQATRALDRDPSLIGFSYRLGRNTRYCYTVDEPQPLPTFEAHDAGVLYFDWTLAEHDFGYPLEVSSSMYRTADVLPAIQRMVYRNPNTLESGLAQEAASFLATKPKLACYGQSVVFSVPANTVQTAWPNRASGRAELTPKALLDRFQRGDRIDIDPYRGFVSSACHQELQYQFIHDPTIPTVSVVIRCYDQAEYLPDAVHSITAQTLTDWEIIIVDDGSPDDTASVARRLASEIGSRLRFIQQANLGLSGAMNTGVAAARGRYILPLDADDMIEPTMFEKTVGLLELDLNIAIAYTDMRRFGASMRVDPAGVWDVDWLCGNNQLNYCSMYRREVWDAVGGYSTSMALGYEDWDFWIGCAEAGFMGKRIAEPLFLYRDRAGTMSTRALAHHQELVAQIRRNHPRQFTAFARARRRFRTRTALRGARSTVRQILGVFGST